MGRYLLHVSCFMFLRVVFRLLFFIFHFSPFILLVISNLKRVLGYLMKIATIINSRFLQWAHFALIAFTFFVAFLHLVMHWCFGALVPWSGMSRVSHLSFFRCDDPHEPQTMNKEQHDTATPASGSKSGFFDLNGPNGLKGPK